MFSNFYEQNNLQSNSIGERKYKRGKIVVELIQLG